MFNWAKKLIALIKGRQIVRCSKCRRVLKDPDSIKNGVGPVCGHMIIISHQVPFEFNGGSSEFEKDKKL